MISQQRCCLLLWQEADFYIIAMQSTSKFHWKTTPSRKSTAEERERERSSITAVLYHRNISQKMENSDFSSLTIREIERSDSASLILFQVFFSLNFNVDWANNQENSYSAHNHNNNNSPHCHQSSQLSKLPWLPSVSGQEHSAIGVNVHRLLTTDSNTFPNFQILMQNYMGSSDWTTRFQSGSFDKYPVGSLRHIPTGDNHIERKWHECNYSNPAGYSDRNKNIETWTFLRLQINLIIHRGDQMPALISPSITSQLHTHLTQKV